MKIIVDSREPEDIRSHFECQPLDNADFHIVDGESIVCLIERKTWADLAASFRDGRSKEQMARMIGSGCPNIYYIIEGKYSKSKCRVEYKTLIKHLTNKCVSSSIKLLPTGNKDETISAVRALFESFRDGGSKSTYVATRKVQKAEMTRDNCLALMLSVIPGVSAYCAEKIAEKYNNSFMAFARSIFHERENALIGMKMSEKRKIGKATAAKIISYLNLGE